MQRKHYRGLSNPQCVHGIEVVRTPNLMGLDEGEQKKWKELTGRELNFTIAFEASDFSVRRNLPSTEIEIERPPSLMNISNTHSKRLLNSSSLNLSTDYLNHVNGDGIDVLAICDRRTKNVFSRASDDDSYLHSDGSVDVHPIEPQWLHEFTGVMRSTYGPVTAAKTIYEDDERFLIILSFPFADLQKVKVTWRNTLSHGIVKITCVSTGCMPILKRQNKTNRLTDPAPEHCPPGEFIREISLPTRIPEDAKLAGYGDETGTMLEIIAPKHRIGSEEHEVRVCFHPCPWTEFTYVDLTEALV